MRIRVGASNEDGFTLLELMIVVAILAIIASIGVPQYVSALRTARIGKARHELVTLANAIDMYRAKHGVLPLTLFQIGFGGRRDPWGHEYCYFNYADGTGDGLQWAIAAGIVDPSAVVGGEQVGGSGGDGGGGGDVGSSAALRAVLIEPPRAQNPPRIRTSTTTVASDPAGALTSVTESTATGTVLGLAATREKIERLKAALAREIPLDEAQAIETSLLGEPGFTVFVGVPAEQTRRRDGYMFPLNSDYDLFSIGPNGSTAISLGESLAQDDIIRANNGGYFGVASEY